MPCTMLMCSTEARRQSRASGDNHHSTINHQVNYQSPLFGWGVVDSGLFILCALPIYILYIFLYIAMQYCIQSQEKFRTHARFLYAAQHHPI